MSDRGASKAGRAVLGFLIGSVVGVWSSAGPLAVGALGALIGIVSVSPSGTPGAGSRAIRAFLEDALRLGDLDEATYVRLVDRLSKGVPAAAVSGPQVASAVRGDLFAPPAPRMSAPPPPAPPQDLDTERPVPPAVAPPPPVRPRPAAQPARDSGSTRPPERRSIRDAAPFLRPLAAFWRSLRADFGVQGLGSLGVLLVFTATLGFVIFAFSEVGTSFRPVAELMVPIVLFGLSSFLRRRSAPFMASALEGLAGAVTPIMVFAAFMDGAPLPPDPERAGLVIALSVASMSLAAVYALVGTRRSTSPLRYLVAPMVWLAVGVVGMSIDEEASAALFSLVIVAVSITAWIPSQDPASALHRAAQAMVVPGLGVAFTFLLVFGFAEGWPLWPMLVGGFASLVALEGARSRVPRVWIAEAVVVAITCAAASIDLGTPWAGALAVAVAIGIAERWIVAGGDRIALAGFASVAVAGVAASVAAPGPLLVVALVLSGWAHTRRLVIAAQLDVVPALVAAVAPGVAGGALGWLTEPWIGLAASAASVLALATLVRTRLPGDGYLAVTTAAYAAVLGVVGVAGVAGELIVDELGLVASAVAIAAAAVAIVPGRRDVRVWLSAALGVAAWFVTGEAAGWTAPTVAVGLAAAALVFVVAGLRVPGRVGGHVAAVGHVVAAVALPLVIDDPSRIVVLGGLIAGWFVEVASEPAGSPLQRLVGEKELLDTSWLAPVPVLGGMPFLALAIVAEVRPTAGLAGAALILATTAVGYGLVAGLPVWRRALTQEALVAGLAASLAALVIATDFDPLIASDRALQLTVVIAGIVGVVLSGRRADPAMHWYAWALTVPAVLLVGLAGGVVVDRLHWVTIGWGAILSIGALVADDMAAGRRDPFQMRTWWLIAPVVVGILSGAVSIAYGLVVPVAEMWPIALAAAVWSGTLAGLLRGGAVTYATWAAAALTYASALVDAGYDPLGEPALLTWATLALLGFGVVMPRRSALGRLDLPPLVVGLGLASVAVGAGIAVDATTQTWAPIGAALLAVAAVRREWLALAPLGSLLVVGAAAIEGPWYLTAVLVAHSSGLGVVARRLNASLGGGVQWVSAVFGAGAWASLLWALDPGLSTTVAATAVASSAVATGAAFLVMRDPDAARHARWSGPWVAVALVGLGLAATAAVTESVLPAGRWSLAVGFLSWFAAATVAATRVDVEELRLTAFTLLGGFVAVVGWAGEFTVTAWSIWTLTLGTLATTAGAATVRTIHRLGWRRWFVMAAGALHVSGAVFAAQLLPDRSLLILALLALSGACVVADLVFEVPGARYLAPGFGFGAWVAFVTELGSADVQWYAPPFAVAVIVDLELLRRQRRTSSRSSVSTEEMVVVELTAMALAIGPALVQVVFDHLAYGLLAIAWGAVAAIWGTATRVRRRVIAGGGGAALGALLMIVVPLAELLPEFRGPALWVAVFAVGAVLIGIAATLEQTRRRFVELKSSFAAMTEGWE